MLAADALQLAIRAITAQRLHSFLTLLGIAVGIAAVILLTSIGEGIHRFVLGEFTAKAGLELERVETFGQSYATTLRLWHERFEAVWPEVAKLGFDEKFRRVWKLYLDYCEAGFAESVVDVGIYKLRKPA